MWHRMSPTQLINFKYGSVATFLRATHFFLCVFVPTLVHFQLSILVANVMALELRRTMIGAVISVAMTFPPFLALIPFIHGVRRIWVLGIIGFIISICLTVSLFFYASFSNDSPNIVQMHHIEQHWHYGSQLTPTATASYAYAQATEMSKLADTDFPYKDCVFTTDREGSDLCQVTLTDPILRPPFTPILAFSNNETTPSVYTLELTAASQVFALSLTQSGFQKARWYGPCTTSPCDPARALPGYPIDLDMKTSN